MICNCFSCPLGKDCYEQRLKLYEHIREEPDYDEIAYNIWCDKIGSKTGWCGFCEDAFKQEQQLIPINNKRRPTRRIQKEIHTEKIKNLYKFTRRRWSSPYYEYEDRLIRSNFSWRTKRFYKKHSNQQVRKCEDVSNGNNYRKVFDYQYMID